MSIDTLRLGPQSESSKSAMWGDFFEQMIRKNLFLYHVPAQAFVLAATGGGHPTLINPLNSGVLFVPVALACSFVSGTTVIGSVLLAETQNVGGGAATGAPIITATLVGSKMARRPGGAGRCQWSPTTNTFTAAPTVISATSLNFGAADPTNSGNPHLHLFNGMLGLEPGTALSLTYSVTTSTALFQSTLYGIEVPYPLQA